MNNWWKYLLVCIIGLLLGLVILFSSCSKEDPEQPRIEYVEVHDTITIDNSRIEEKTKPKYILLKDTFYVTETDTVYVVNLPVEYKVYEDTINTDSSSTELKIDYHGFQSEIDGVQVITNYFNRTEYIPEKKKKVYWTWCVGPYAGFGGNINITPDKQLGAGFSAGVCFSIGIGGPLNQ